MKQENMFTAGYVLFLASEAQKYAAMDEGRTFCETIHYLDPETDQYTMRVVCKTPSQKIMELKNDICSKMSAMHEDDYNEVRMKIDEYLADSNMGKDDVVDRFAGVKEFVNQTLDECPFTYGDQML